MMTRAAPIMTRPTGMPTSSPSFFLEPLEAVEFFVSRMVGPVRTVSSSEETKKRVRLAVDLSLSQALDMLMYMAPSELRVLSPSSGSVEAVLSVGLSKYSTSTVAVVSAEKREVSQVTVA